MRHPAAQPAAPPAADWRRRCLRAAGLAALCAALRPQACFAPAQPIWRPGAPLQPPEYLALPRSVPRPPRRSRAAVALRATEADFGSAYQAFVRANGKAMTGMAWQSFQQLGRGAIYVNDASSQALLYVKLDDWTKKKPTSLDDLAGLDEIVERVREYNPELQFVVVFESGGRMLADIVKPSIPPPQVVPPTPLQPPTAGAGVIDV
mmetsp:Transcript_35829/g.94957  ORF Transcript_35829/g.94957 Transcript_35829/m.94957 type:complete len:206 (+) Transcript_35829:66-683(+)